MHDSDPLTPLHKWRRRAAFEARVEYSNADVSRLCVRLDFKACVFAVLASIECLRVC